MRDTDDLERAVERVVEGLGLTWEQYAAGLRPHREATTADRVDALQRMLTGVMSEDARRHIGELIQTLELKGEIENV